MNKAALQPIPCFKVLNSAVHGMGWIATSSIPSKSSILDENPSFCIPKTKVNDIAWIMDVLAKCPDDVRESFLALDGRNVTEKLKLHCSPLIDDYQADPLALKERKNVAIYLQYARLNHSCRPNATAVFGENNVMSVVSLENIKEGTEITISYLYDNFKSCAGRISELRFHIMEGNKDIFSQGCKCNLCTSSSSAIQESDVRRQQLAAFREMLLQDRLPSSLAIKFLLLLKAEGLDATAMGAAACGQLCQKLWGIDRSFLSRDKMNALAFDAGARVRISGLKERKEINGRTGVVVRAFDSKTQRVGVKLDQAVANTSIVAVRCDNLIYLKAEREV